MSDQGLELKLSATLDDFKKKNHLSTAQLETLFGNRVFKSQSLRKGGVGLIYGDVYAVLDRERNTVLIRGKEWQGSDRTQGEVVIVRGDQVLGSVQGSDLADVKILIFSPEHVQYIDLARGKGGQYARFGK